MEGKKSLIETIKDVNNNNDIITEWMREENARLKHEGEMSYAREERREDTKLELIKNMLIKKYLYDDISDLTGNKIEEIKEIEETLRND